MRPQAERLALAVMVLAAAGPATAADLRSCRQVQDAPARLACYDGLAAAAEPSAPPAVAPADRFGAETLKADKAREPEKDQPAEIHSRLVGAFKGWEPRTRFTLENGQVWKAIGSESTFYPGIAPNPAVRVRRGLFGSYWLSVEGVGREARVQRIK